MGKFFSVTVIISALFVFVKPSWADHRAKGAWMNILKLHPLQIPVGMGHVKEKIEKHRIKAHKFKGEDLKDYLDKHPFYITLGKAFDGDKVATSFIDDDHHESRSLWEEYGDELEIRAIVERDWSHLSSADFWKKMLAENLVYTRDQFGRELCPDRSKCHPMAFLPENVRGLADDPYRSLASSVQEKGGFPKSQIPFYQFNHADKYRKAISPAMLRNNYARAVECALKIEEAESLKN